MPFYRIFGTWTTADQALLSFSANLLVLIAIILLPLRKTVAKRLCRVAANSFMKKSPAKLSPNSE
jgi:hypothetical protein